MKIKSIFAIVSLFLVMVSFVPFHHGWADYDQENPKEFTGPIQQLSYENPHVIIKIKEEAKIWTVYLAPISRMQARGVTENMIKKGEVIKILAYPHKTVKDEMRAERIFREG